MNMPKSREIRAKMPSPKGDFKCIFACNCEGTEQLPIFIKGGTKNEMPTLRRAGRSGR